MQTNPYLTFIMLFMNRISVILTSIVLVSTLYSCEEEEDFSVSEKTVVVDDSEKEEDFSISERTGVVDGHDYVDLGLSVRWATCNLGAQKPGEIGEFYAWAETTPYNEWTHANYNYDYAPCNTDYVVDAKYDAITANWGNSWRTPTKEEIDELIDPNNCEWIWIDSIDGTDVSGYKVKSKKNEKSIFLPAGHSYMSKPAGWYWSSTADPSVFRRPYDQSPWVIFFIDGVHYESASKCYSGLSVRGVVGSPNVYFPEKDAAIDDSETERQGFTVNGKVGDHTYVDLGLPSRTLWATYNVGASLPYEYGEYYAWGETEPKDLYVQETYKYFLEYSESKNHWAQYSKYIWDERHGKQDYKLTLDPEDDAATVNWGALWQMPSKEQMEELAYYCKWYSKSLSINGQKIVGYIGESKLNGNKLYIPFSDFKYAEVPLSYLQAWYWSRDLSGNATSFNDCDDYRAYFMTIKADADILVIADTRRMQGLPIRAVVKQ